MRNHEAGRVVLASNLGDLLLQFGRPSESDTRTALIGYCRIGPVGGQEQAFRHAPQCLIPIVQLGCDQTALVIEVSELRTLPQGVVDVLHWKRIPQRGLPRTSE